MKCKVNCISFVLRYVQQCNHSINGLLNLFSLTLGKNSFFISRRPHVYVILNNKTAIFDNLHTSTNKLRHLHLDGTNANGMAGLPGIRFYSQCVGGAIRKIDSHENINHNENSF